MMSTMNNIPIYSRKQIVNTCLVDPDIQWLTETYDLKWYVNQANPTGSPKLSFRQHIGDTATTWHLYLSRVVYFAKEYGLTYNEELLNTHPYFTQTMGMAMKSRLYIAANNVNNVLTMNPLDCRRENIIARKNTKLHCIAAMPIFGALQPNTQPGEANQNVNVNALDSLENDTELMAQLQQLSQKYETDEKIKSIETIDIGDMNSTEDSTDIAFDLMFMKQNQIDTIEALHSVYLKMPHIKRKYDEEKAKYETEIETQ